MRKKWLATLLSLAMVLSLLPTWAIATEPVTVGTEAELKTAVEAGGEIALTEDILNVNGPINVENNVTLNLNGHTLSAVNLQTQIGAAAHSLFTVKANATLTINGNDDEDSTVEGGLVVGTASDNDAALILNGGTYIAQSNDFYDYAVIQTNGSATGCSMTVNDATLTGSNTGIAVYAAGAGTVNLTDSTITSGTAVYVKSGTTTITNCTLEGKLNPADYEYSGNGANSTGDALLVDACGYPGGAPEVTISGGEFSGTKAAIGYYLMEGKDPANITITGGTFSDFSALDYLADDADVTIELADDVTLDKGLDIAGTVTLDLNGHKVDTAETDYEEDYVIDVMHGGNLTVKDSGTNGMIDGTTIKNSNGYCSSAIKMTKKGGDNTKKAVLTIEGGTIQGIAYGIGGNGNAGRDNTEITISGGFIRSTGTEKVKTDVPTGIYQPQKGTLTITAGTIEGLNGVYVKCGETTVAADVTGGTIKTTADNTTEYEFNGNGAAASGYAFAVDNAKYPGGVPNVAINGGDFEGPVGSFAKEGETKLTGFITGGTFSSDPAAFVAPGYEAKGDDTNGYTVTKESGVVAGDDFQNDAKLSNEKIGQITENPAMTEEFETGIDALATTGSVLNAAVKDALATEAGANADAVEAAVDAGSFYTYVKVAPKAATEPDEPGGVKLTFDAKPMVKVTTGTTSVETELTPDMVASSAEKFETLVTFRLPLTNDFAEDSTVKVTHYNSSVETVADIDEGEVDEVFYAEVKESSGGRYVELLVDHFCLMCVEPTGEDFYVQVIDSYGENETVLRQYVYDGGKGIYDAIAFALEHDAVLELLPSDNVLDYGFEFGTDITEYDKTLKVKSNGATIRALVENNAVIKVLDRPDMVTNTKVRTETVLTNANENGKFNVGNDVTVNIVATNTDTEEDLTAYKGAYFVVEYDTRYLTYSGVDTSWKNYPGTYPETGKLVFWDMTEKSNLTGGVVTQLKFTAAKSCVDGTPVTITTADLLADMNTAVCGCVYASTIETTAALVEIALQTNEWLTIPSMQTEYVYTGNAVTAENKGTALGGEPTVTFYKTSDDTTPIEAPTDVGEYKAVFTVAETDDYTGLDDSETWQVREFKITPAKLDLNTEGVAHQTELTYTGDSFCLLANGVLPTQKGLNNEDVVLTEIEYKIGEKTYSTHTKVKASTVGDYIVKITAKPANTANYVFNEAEILVKIVNPVYKVAITEYVTGYNMVYVFTDGEAHFKCGGNAMFNVSDFRYKFVDVDEVAKAEDTDTTAEDGKYTYVYARLVKSGDSVDVTAASRTGANANTDKKRNGTFLSLNSDESIYDINYSHNVDIGDAVLAAATYNLDQNGFAAYSGATGLAAKVKACMAHIVRADVDRNGKVEMLDTNNGLIGDVLRIKEQITNPASN